MSEPQSPVPSPARPSKPAQPNVAVITVYDKELGQREAHQHKRHKKSPAKKKKQALAVQVRYRWVQGMYKQGLKVTGILLRFLAKLC